MVDITPILTSALQLVAAIFTIMGTFVIKAYVIPWFKAKLSKEQQDSIKSYIEAAMAAAKSLCSARPAPAADFAEAPAGRRSQCPSC